MHQANSYLRMNKPLWLFLRFSYLLLCIISVDARAVVYEVATGQNIKVVKFQFLWKCARRKWRSTENSPWVGVARCLKARCCEQCPEIHANSIHRFIANVTLHAVWNDTMSEGPREDDRKRACKPQVITRLSTSKGYPQAQWIWKLYPNVYKTS